MITRSKLSSQCFIHTKPSALYSDSEPPSHTEALLSPIWLKAMQAEFDALHQQHTWSLVCLPPGKTAIGCKWVFKVKRNSDGTIARHKARLVAKGYLQ
ncbi:hypothetical protein CsSME_00020374 [Camellia sinensis var. sinensis]